MTMALDSQGNGCYNSQKESGSGREGPTGGRREAGAAARPSAPEGAGPAVTAGSRRLPRPPRLGARARPLLYARAGPLTRWALRGAGRAAAARGAAGGGTSRGPPDATSGGRPGRRGSAAAVPPASRWRRLGPPAVPRAAIFEDGRKRSERRSGSPATSGDGRGSAAATMPGVFPVPPTSRWPLGSPADPGLLRGAPACPVAAANPRGLPARVCALGRCPSWHTESQNQLGWERPVIANSNQ